MPRSRKQNPPESNQTVTTSVPPSTPSQPLTSDQPGDLTPAPLVSDQDFEQGFDEPLERTLDLDSWNDGRDLNAIFDRVDKEVSEALFQEDALRAEVRKDLFPIIATRPRAPKQAGVFQATRQQLVETQLRVLLNGGIEACDGTCAVHDTLPLTVTQIGVCLVSYLGGQGAWGHQLFRKDLHLRGDSPIEEAKWELLERRQQRAELDQDNPRDRLSELGRRGIMSYAERAVLLQLQCGHGPKTVGKLPRLWCADLRCGGFLHCGHGPETVGNGMMS